MIFIVGPTCSGKTHVSINFAKKLKIAEIVSADSRQIYKQLSIGTAKPEGSWRLLNGKKYFVSGGVPHHLIDFIEPDKFFSAGDFVETAQKAVIDIRQRKKVPLFIGGTGLYIDSFIDGIAELPQRNQSYRRKLYGLEKKHGREFLYKMLCKADPESAGKIHPNNIQRIIRALEVYHITGKPISEIHKNSKSIRRGGQNPKFRNNHILFGLNWERAKLYDRINERVEWMLENGMIEETEKLISKGYEPGNSPALKSVGYKHVIDFLNKNIPYERMKSLIQQDTRNYAKRQLTWFRRNKNISWIDCSNFDADKITGIISRYKNIGMSLY